MSLFMFQFDHPTEIYGSYVTVAVLAHSRDEALAIARARISGPLDDPIEEKITAAVPGALVWTEVIE